MIGADSAWMLGGVLFVGMGFFLVGVTVRGFRAAL
jgi:hypothetical protein